MQALFAHLNPKRGDNRRMLKNKTLATWLALLGGPLGLHRFYLKGRTDLIGWLLWLPTLLGLYGVHRVRLLGLDDHLSWMLLPLLGFVLGGCALNALVYGLMQPAAWNARFNPQAAPETAAGKTNWLTIGALVAAMLLGTIGLISGIVLSAHRFFEYDNERLGAPAVVELKTAPDSASTPR